MDPALPDPAQRNRRRRRARAGGAAPGNLGRPAQGGGGAAVVSPPHGAGLLEGSLTRAILRLSGPVFVSMLLHTLFNVVNAIWVGRLGAVPLGAVTTAIFATWTLLGLAELVAIGLVAVVSRHLGAGAPEKASHAAAQGLLLSFAMALGLAALSGVAPPALFRLLGTPPEVSAAGILYLQPLLLFALPSFLMIALEAVLRAHGNTRTPMLITLAAVGLNLGLDPFLIFGWGPFPALGVRGAAIATVIAHVVGAVLFLAYFYRHRRFVPGFTRHLRRPDPVVLARIIRIGAPPTLSTILYSVVYLVLSRVAAQLGTSPLAILGVGNRLESFSWLASSSLGAAVSALVGQSLGAGLRRRAGRAAAIGAALGGTLSGAIGLVFFLLGGVLFGAFIDDPEVRRQGGQYMRVLAISQPFMGIEIVLLGAFAGAGYTLRPTWISAGISLFRIPLAFIVALGLGLGLTGLVWVISLTCILRGMLMLLLFRRGRWLDVRV